MRNGSVFCAVMVIFTLGMCGCARRSGKEPHGTVRFSWWGRENRAEYTLEGIQHFSTLHPSIAVLTTYDSWSHYVRRFEQDFPAGAAADVMQLNFDWLSKYSPDGDGFYDLNTLSRYIELYNFTLDELATGTVNGKLNAIPIAFNTAIPVYDKDSLDAYNSPVPATWDELFALARKLKADDKYVFTISNRHLFFITIAWFEQTYTKKVFSSDGSLNLSAEEIGAMFDFVRRLEDEHVIYSPTKGYKLSALRTGKIVGAILWCNEVNQFISEVEKCGAHGVLGNFITVPGATQSGWYVKPALLYAIKKDCQNPEAAAVLLNYLLNDTDFALLQKNERGVPVSNKSLSALMEHGELESLQYEALLKIRFNSESINPMLPVMENTGVIESFADSAFAYSAGSLSQNEAAARFVKAAAGGNQ